MFLLVFPVGGNRCRAARIPESVQPLTFDRRTHVAICMPMSSFTSDEVFGRVVETGSQVGGRSSVVPRKVRWRATFVEAARLQPAQCA